MKATPYPIDFVITWVDGGDKAWQAEKAGYSQTEGGDQREVRFRDWALLPYWFRAVEAFAPWVNRIHFVTWGHLPAWLNTEHPKLHIVSHRDFIPEEYLPTFSSHTIELNLHRIPGLSEHFVYFNDDMFLTAPGSPEDFIRQGLPGDSFALNAIYFGPDSVGLINGCSLELINKHFSMRQLLRQNGRKWLSPANGPRKLLRTLLLLPWPWFPGFYYEHTTLQLRRSTLEEVWACEPVALAETCRERFRGKAGLSPWLFRFWQLAKGEFVPRSSRYHHCFHIKDSVEALCESIQRQRYHVICVNDTGATTAFEEKAAAVQASFARLLPERSSYET